MYTTNANLLANCSEKGLIIQVYQDSTIVLYTSITVQMYTCSDNVYIEKV